MNLAVIGINHKTAPVEIREHFCFNGQEQELLLSKFKSNPSISEAFILSTCNRTEIYINALANSRDFLWTYLDKGQGLLQAGEWKKYFYSFNEQEAVKHLFEVACGLDSLILGEKQILNQLKEAFDLSRSHSMMKRTMNLLTNLALKTGKKARSQTSIDAGGSSVSWAAVANAQRELGTLTGKSVLIIGAGKMGSLALRQLKVKGVKDIYIANRSESNAKELAQEFGAQVVSFFDLNKIMPKIDIVICSASAPHYLVQPQLIERAMNHREDRTMVCIDISMPRNIDPNVGKVPNVVLWGIDDLDRVLEDNIAKRMQAAQEVSILIDRAVQEFFVKLNKTSADTFAGASLTILAGQGT